MSSNVEIFLKANPLLIKYTQSGLVNIASLARYVKDNCQNPDKKSTVAAIGMDIRRLIKKMPKQASLKTAISNIPLHVVTRGQIQELIFDKTGKNREVCLNLFNQITKTKHFSCLVEGEKEIVLMTDYDVNEFLKDNKVKNIVSNHTKGLGFISVDFPIRLRTVVGIYGYVTTSLAQANIPIHSFHTIGGEILILVKNEDLIKAQEILDVVLKIL